MNSILSNVSKPESVVFIVTPSPELSLGIYSHCALSANAQTFEDGGLVSDLDLFEVSAFPDVSALSE